VKINLPGIKNEEEKEKYLQEANKILENANKLGIKIENLVNKNLG